MRVDQEKSPPSVGAEAGATNQNQQTINLNNTTNLNAPQGSKGTAPDTHAHAALDYSKRGFRVLPLHTAMDEGCSCGKDKCDKVGKHARIKGWPEKATTDQSILQQWWQQWPQTNIGIATGGRSGLVVLDVDPQHGGEDTLGELVKQYGPLPDTPEVLTGGGGRHLFFAHPGPDITIRNDVGKKLGPGLDIRGDGGYVVAAPSLHKSGQRYAWASSKTLDDVGLAPLPGWILYRLQSSKKPNNLTDSIQGGDPIPTGKRNTTLASLAGTMRNRGMTEPEILTALLAVNQARCNPPLEEAEVREIVSSIARYQPGGGHHGPHHHGLSYDRRPEGLFYLRTSRGRSYWQQLTNYTANIVADVLEDDGVETRHQFHIHATLQGKHKAFAIPAQHFSTMNWPLEKLGAQAITYPGQSIKEHAKVAIQTLSTEVQQKRVYTHTGWRKLDSGGWVYLHQDGAVGPVGHESDVEVALESVLSRYQLPVPPTDHALQHAIRRSLCLVDLAPDTISFSMFAAIWRAVLGNTPFSIHLVGPTGAMKSTLAALVQQHFGHQMTANALPGNWSSTANALESLCFAGKDVVLTIDDFCPTGSSTDVQRLHAAADRLLRGQGNTAGRHRLRSDATLRPTKIPRGLIVSTGEDVPKGHSLRARMWVIEVGPGDLNLEGVTECQRDAGAGIYAEALAGFVHWLAPKMDSMQSELREEINALRTQATGVLIHKRVPEIVANLGVGLRYFIKFAIETGVLSHAKGQELWQRGWMALNEVAAQQLIHQRASDPVQRFLELLNAALIGGHGHLASMTGEDPFDANNSSDPDININPFGWRRHTIGAGTNTGIDWRPKGDRIGWFAGDDLYLQPDVAFNVAQKLGLASATPLTITPQILRKRLDEQGFLKKEAQQRENRLTVRRTIEGKRREVLWLPLSALHLDEPESEIDETDDCLVA